MFRPKAQALSLFDPAIVRRASVDALRKLAPQHVAKNPVMFVVEIGSVLTTLIFIRDLARGGSAGTPLWFTGAVTVWLWFTVIFANFAEAVAEGRGKAQADTLRKMRKETTARKLVSGANGKNRKEEVVASSALRKGDLVVVEAGQLIPGDGEIVEGIASVDESAITGESAPVIELDHIFLAFQNPILEDVSFTARQGETICIVGESGTGKSTSLKLILRLLVPDKGQVRILGEDITDLTFEEALQLVSEEAARLLVDQWGFTIEDAFIFLSVACDAGVAQACRPAPGFGTIARFSIPRIEACPRPFG